MFQWALLGSERYVRSTSRTLARRLDWIPPWLIRKLADAKLVNILRYVYRNCPQQRERWESVGIRLKDIRSPDILRHIPFLSAEQLAENPEGLFCVPPEAFVHVIGTSGTSGHAKKVFFTRDDMLRQTRMIGTNLCRLPGASRVLTTYRFRMPDWPAGFISWQGIVNADMLALAAGSEMSSQEQLKLIREYRVNVIMGVPSYIHRITLEAETDLKNLNVKYLLLCGQPWTEECRAELEQAWGAKALDVYATNECGCGLASECIHQNGLHIAEVDFHVEIIDPETKNPVDDGELGEVVVTTMNRMGMPLIRYRVGDLAYLIPRDGRCECGLPLRKMSRIRGRIDDMLIIGNALNCYPDEIDKAVLSVSGIVDYQLLIEHEGYKDILHLTVESARDGSELKEEVHKALSRVEVVGESLNETHTLAFGRFQRVPVGTLTRERLKSVRIIDRRQ